MYIRIFSSILFSIKLDKLLIKSSINIVKYFNLLIIKYNEFIKAI